MSQTELVQIERRHEFSENEFWAIYWALDNRQWQNLSFPQLMLEDLSSKRAENFVTPPDAAVPECLTCGACCTFLFAVCVKPTDETPAENVWNVTDDTGAVVVDRFLRRNSETLHCAALDKTLCRIYERRPHDCRVFEAGSDKCHALRRACDFEPPLSAMEMYAAMQALKTRKTKPVRPEIIRDVEIVKQPAANRFAVVVALQDGSSHLIHSFDSDCEYWLKFELSGLTLDAARRLIDSRSNAAKFD